MNRMFSSIVLSLIMLTGVTAGGVAFADSDDDVIEDFEDCVEAGYPVMESYPEKCMTDDGTVFVNDEDNDDFNDDRYDDDKLEDKINRWCEMTDAEKKEVITKHDKSENKVAEMNRYCTLDESERDAYLDKHERDYKMHTDKDMRHSLEKYCEMSEDDRAAYIAEHDKDADKAAKMDRYCTLDEDGKTDFIHEHLDEYRAYMKDKIHDKMTDKKHMNYDRLCAMAESDRAAEITDMAKLDRISQWCDMTPEERDEYKMKHHDKTMDKMHDKYSNKGTGNIRDRFAMYCDMTFEERTLMMDSIHSDLPNDLRTDMMRYCEMSHDDQDNFRDHMMDRMDTMFEYCDDCPFDRMSDIAKDRMSDIAKDKLHDKAMKFSDESKRLKMMIMEKHDISDERHDEIRMKYEEKHGDKGDKKRAELKMKFKNHMATIKIKMSDERKSEVHNRVAEMKEFKVELRDRSSDITDEEKQELREEFIEKAKDIRLAWISPRTQMTAGIDATEVECREGFSHVMKASNGVAMCLKADSALKMIDRGIVIPAI